MTEPSNKRSRRLLRVLGLAAVIVLLLLIATAWRLRRYQWTRAIEVKAKEQIASVASHFSLPPTTMDARAAETKWDSSSVYFEPCQCSDPAFTNEALRRDAGCPGVAPASGAHRQHLLLRNDSANGIAETRVTLANWISAIPGLVTRASYVSAAMQEQIVGELEKFPFKEYFGKSCQEFGMNFSFYIDHATAEKMPPSVYALAKRLIRDELLYPMPNYVLVNRYRAGEGIHPHVDDAYYDGGIASVSLSSGAALQFTLDEYGPYFHHNAHIDVLVKYRSSGKQALCRSAYFPSGSFFSMQQEARLGWKHEMMRRQADSVPFTNHAVPPWNRSDPVEWIDGPHLPPGARLRSVKQRELRYALTFRHIREDVIQSRWKGIRVASNAYA
jgi:hypothetical protein